MKLRVTALGCLLLFAAVAVNAQPRRKDGAGNPARQALRPGGGSLRKADRPRKGPPPEAREGAARGGAARLGNPANPVERLMAMSPEMRERVLEKLPPKQQANLRERLQRFDQLPAPERERLNRMWATFNALPPEKQASVQRQMQAFNALPEDRRRELRPVLQRLRNMPEPRRQALLNSDAFKNRFSAAEQEMLTEISENYPLPRQ